MDSGGFDRNRPETGLIRTALPTRPSAWSSATRKKVMRTACFGLRSDVCWCC